MPDSDQESLVGNIVARLSGAQKRLQLLQTALFCKADADFGLLVARDFALKRSRSAA